MSPELLIALVVGIPWVAGTALALSDGRRKWVGWAAVAALGAAMILTGVLLGVVISGGRVSVVAGGWPEGVGITLRADALGLVFALVSSAVVFVGLLYELLVGIESRTFPALTLFVNAGLTGLFLTGDIFNFYVFFEVAMTASYVLAGYRERDYQVRGAFIFAIVNLLGSVIFVIGVAALYHLTGSLDMEVVAQRLEGVPDAPKVSIAAAIFAAFSLKLGIFPFHFWLPAVYVGSHASVAAILSGALANIGSYGLLRFGADIMPGQLQHGTSVILVLGTASIIYGALQAVSRRAPVEVMAYSSIGQVGYILVALAIGGPVGYAAAVLYALVNSVNKLLVFLATGLRGPLVGGAFAIGAFSIAGVPPAAGFLGKLSLFRASLDVGSVAGAAVLAFLVFFGSILSFVYAFQAYQRRYLREPKVSKPSPVSSRVLVMSVAVALVIFGLWPQPLLAVSEQAASALVGSTP